MESLIPYRVGVLHLIMLYFSYKYVKIKFLKFNKEQMYQTNNLYKVHNMLSKKKIFLKVTGIYLLNHNLLHPLLRRVNT